MYVIHKKQQKTISWDEKQDLILIWFYRRKRLVILMYIFLQYYTIQKNFIFCAIDKTMYVYLRLQIIILLYAVHEICIINIHFFVNYYDLIIN